MGGLAEWILQLSPVAIYAVVAILVFAEDAIFVGFAIPGETAAVVGGVAASFGRVDLPVAMALVVAMAVLGDTVGYEVGRHYFGPKVLEGSFLSRHAHRIERGQQLLRRRGGVAVFLGRWTAFFRAMMPALAGAARMPYRTFLLWNALGGLAWGVTFVTLGHAAGSSYKVVEAKAGQYVAVALATVVLVALVAWHLRRRRAE